MRNWQQSPRPSLRNKKLNPKNEGRRANQLEARRVVGVQVYSTENQTTRGSSCRLVSPPACHLTAFRRAAAESHSWQRVWKVPGLGLKGVGLGVESFECLRQACSPNMPTSWFCLPRMVGGPWKAYIAQWALGCLTFLGLGFDVKT